METDMLSRLLYNTIFYISKKRHSSTTILLIIYDCFYLLFYPLIFFLNLPPKFDYTLLRTPINQDEVENRKKVLFGFEICTS